LGDQSNAYMDIILSKFQPSHLSTHLKILRLKINKKTQSYSRQTSALIG